MLKTFGSIFFLGLSFGAGPCLASCGPLVLSYIAGTKKDVFRGCTVYLLFSAARITTYVILGLAVFYFGRFAEQRLFGNTLYRYLVFLGSLFIIFCGILISLGKKIKFPPWQFFYRHFLERDKKSIVLLGLLIGFLPCAPLIAVFSSLGLVSKSWLECIGYSISFGLGTLISPLLLLAIIAGAIPAFLNQRVYRVFSFICGLIIIALGLQLALRTF